MILLREENVRPGSPKQKAHQHAKQSAGEAAHQEVVEEVEVILPQEVEVEEGVQLRVLCLQAVVEVAVVVLLMFLISEQ